MLFSTKEKNFNSTLYIYITVPALDKGKEMKIVVSSISRNGVEYELFDTNNKLMSTRGYVFSRGRFINDLLEEVNILLEEFNASITMTDIAEPAKLAYIKAESRYGYSIAEGDAVITIKGL